MTISGHLVSFAMTLFTLLSPSLQGPVVHILLQSLVNQFLSESYCLTIVSDEPIDFNFNLSFTSLVPNSTVEELKDQLLVVSEQGCSDYIVYMKDRNMFMRAFDMVSKTGNVRRSDRKIIFLPLPKGTISENDFADLFSMKETNHVANIVIILPAKDKQTSCEVFDLLTHRFIGSEGESHQPMLINRWDTCTQELETNNYLFPNDLRDLFGKPVRLGAFTYPPYSMFDLDSTLSPLGRDGTEIRIVEEFCRWVNCTVKMVRELEYQWGEIFENGTGTGVLGSVVDDRADMGIGGIYTWYEQFQYLDFSTPSSTSSVTSVAPSPRLLASWAIPLMPFNRSMWCAVIITFVFASVAFIIAKGCKTDRAFLTIFGVMISQSQNNAEGSWRVRRVTGWLLVACLILDSAYGGGLASTFTVPQYEPSVDTMQDLIDRNMVWAATHEAWVLCLILSEEPVTKQIAHLFRTYSEEELLRKSNENKIAFGVEKLLGGHYGIGDFLTLEALEDKTVMVEDFYYGAIVTVLRKSSVYTEKLSVLIGRLQQSGLILAWETQVALNYFDLKKQQEVKMSRTRKNVGLIKPLDIHNIEGIFILYAIGVASSILLLIGERITINYKLKLRV